ncbi:MAG TPA: peptide chain release factor N(5)-glutamine methyltransferase [Ktedonobacterales bacterium]|nr:peptide chain release factor N(5)-glutamine methyltransferase [Ktedonobacterales bacterium]
MADKDDKDDVQRQSVEGARTLGEALRLAEAWLRAAGVNETPALDAQVTLGHVTGASRTTLLAYPERPLTAEQAARYADLIARRAAHEPVAYLTGRREFMGIDLLVDRRALIPRPETELLVEAALRDLAERLARDPGAPPLVADIGVGSGAIPIALAVREPRLPRIYATDISPDALALARENAERLGVADRITFLLGDLLAPLPEPVDMLTANLPYVSADDPDVPPSVSRYEPALALYGDDDHLGRGLGHIRRLLAQAPARLRPGASLYLEFGYDQREMVEWLARDAFPDATLRVGVDYAGWDRYIEIRLRG